MAFTYFRASIVLLLFLAACAEDGPVSATTNVDLDGDGLVDTIEIELGTNPTLADSDGDGLLDGQEQLLGTDPLDADSDGDGFSDGDEIGEGSNPLDSSSKPNLDNKGPVDDGTEDTMDTGKDDVLGPDTTLVGAPPVFSNLNNVSFAFRSDQNDVTFDCKLDENTFNPCENPKTYAGISEGEHTFQVRAVGLQARDDTPAEFTFTIDRSAPQLLNLVLPAAATNAVDPILFDVNEAGTITCNLLFTPPDLNPLGLRQIEEACSSPFDWHAEGNPAYEGEGAYTLQISTVDALGNTSNVPVSWAWNYDKTAPVLQIDAQPAAVTADIPQRVEFSSDEFGAFNWCELTKDGVPEDVELCLSPYDITDTAEATYSLRITATDAAGNLALPVVAGPWLFDATPPMLFVDPIAPVVSAVTVAVTVTGVTVLDTVAFLGDSADQSYRTPPVASFALTNVEGYRTVEVVARDAVGNQSNPITLHTWLDLNPPLVTLSSPTPQMVTNSSFAVSGTVTDAVSAVAAVYVSVTGPAGWWDGSAFVTNATEIVFVAPDSFGLSVTPVVSGTYAIQITATDPFRASEAVTRNVLFDNEGPSCAACLHIAGTYAPWVSSTSLAVTMTATDAFAPIEVSFAGDVSSPAGWVQAADVTTVVLFAGEGARNVQFVLRDPFAQQTGPYAVAVTVDTVAPASPGLTVATPFVASDSFGVYLTESGLASGFSSPVSGSWVAGQVVHAPKRVVNGFAALQVPAAEASYTITAVSFDALGNRSEMASLVVTLDTSDPTVSILNPEADSTLGASPVTGLVSDAGSAVSEVEYFLARGAYFWDGAGFTSFSAVWHAAMTSPTGFVAGIWQQPIPGSIVDGPLVLSVRARDRSGNTSAQTLPIAVSLDRSAPTCSPCIAAAGDLITSATTYEFNLDATDATWPLEMRIDGDIGDSFKGTWQPFAATVAVQFSSVDGIKDVRVQYRDAGGNTSPEAVAQVTLDTTGPVVSTFLLHGGASITTSTTVTAYTVASDATELMFTGQVSQPAAGMWIAYNAVTSLVLPGAGWQSVFVTARDTLGNSGAPVVASITVEAPAVDAPAGITAYTNSLVTVLSWNPVTGADSYEVYYGNAPGVTSGTGLPAGDSPVTTSNAGLVLRTGAASWGRDSLYFTVRAVSDSTRGDSSNSFVAHPIGFDGPANLGSWDAATLLQDLTGDGVPEVLALSAGSPGYLRVLHGGNGAVLGGARLEADLNLTDASVHCLSCTYGIGRKIALLMPNQVTADATGLVRTFILDEYSLQPWVDLPIPAGTNRISAIGESHDIGGDRVPEYWVSASNATAGGQAAAGYVALYDGHSDIPVWSSAGTMPAHGLGRAVATAGDWDGDSLPDLVVTADGSVGSALHVLSGADGTRLVALAAPAAASASYGASVAGNHNQLVAGDPGSGPGGALFVYANGTTSGPVAEQSGQSCGAFGSTIQAAKDLDFDGVQDWYVQADACGAGVILVPWLAGYATTGVALVAADLGVTEMYNPTLQYEGIQVGQRILVRDGAGATQLVTTTTWSAGLPRSIQGELTDDLLIRVPHKGGGVLQLETSSSGASVSLDTLTIPGGAFNLGVDTVYATVPGLGHQWFSAVAVTFGQSFPLTTPASGDQMGNGIAWMPDLNGDGHPDVAVGAPGDNAGAGLVHFLQFENSQPARGAVAAPDAKTGFGQGLARIPDVDNDGRPDLVVGATGGVSGKGKLYALSATDFSEIWSFQYSSGLVFGDHFGANVKYVPEWQVVISSLVVSPGTLTANRVTDGTLAWQLNLGNTTPYPLQIATNVGVVAGAGDDGIDLLVAVPGDGVLHRVRVEAGVPRVVNTYGSSGATRLGLDVLPVYVNSGTEPVLLLGEPGYNSDDGQVQVLAADGSLLRVDSSGETGTYFGASLVLDCHGMLDGSVWVGMPGQYSDAGGLAYLRPHASTQRVVRTPKTVVAGSERYGDSLLCSLDRRTPAISGSRLQSSAGSVDRIWHDRISLDEFRVLNRPVTAVEIRAGNGELELGWAAHTEAAGYEAVGRVRDGGVQVFSSYAGSATAGTAGAAYSGSVVQIGVRPLDGAGYRGDAAGMRYLVVP